MIFEFSTTINIEKQDILKDFLNEFNDNNEFNEEIEIEVEVENYTLIGDNLADIRLFTIIGDDYNRIELSPIFINELNILPTIAEEAAKILNNKFNY